MQQAPMARLSSSLRTRSAEESLQIAAPLAKTRGVSRVTDTTWLDRIGLPVFASIRPDGAVGALCVHAGKGFTAAEAKIGAFMEAIEFSFAAPGRSDVTATLSGPAEILDSFKSLVTFPEFCPRIASNVAEDDAIPVIVAEELLQGLDKVLLPAELVFHPFCDAKTKSIFGTSTNGLASGNTLEEATTHGLAEILERHVCSFDLIDNQSQFVHLGDIQSQPKLRKMVDIIEKAGLTCALRYTQNEFGMPHFSAYVLEPDESNPIAVATGHGLHPVREIAAVRALAEAVQSRLSHIHGGRDDIIKRVQVAKDLGREKELETLRLLREFVTASNNAIDYLAIPDFEPAIASITDAYNCMTAALRKAGFNLVARVVFTPKDYPFQVVRIVIPGAEFYERELQRVGPRLLAHRVALENARHQTNSPYDALARTPEGTV